MPQNSESYSERIENVLKAIMEELIFITDLLSRRGDNYVEEISVFKNTLGRAHELSLLDLTTVETKKLQQILENANELYRNLNNLSSEFEENAETFHHPSSVALNRATLSSSKFLSITFLRSQIKKHEQRDTLLEDINSFKEKIILLEKKLNEINEPYIASVAERVYTEAKQDTFVKEEIINQASEQFNKQLLISYAASARAWFGFALLLALITIAVATLFFSNGTFIKADITANQNLALSILLREAFYKFFILAFLSSLMFFCFRQYSLNKHNQLHMAHKNYSLSAFENLMAKTHLNEEARNSIISLTLEAIFYRPDFGYLKDKQIKQSEEIIEIIKAIKSENLK